MLAILRAFAWMRWRVLVNSLERTGARDTLERLSIAFDQLGPLVAAVLFVPSALGLAALAGYAGYQLGATATPPLAFSLLRYLLLAASALCLAGPILLPVAERTNPIRLLLLPIPRTVLYAAQSATALADPWILLVVPVVISLPLGLALGGAPGPALVALAAGVLLIGVMIGLSSIATTMLHLVVRDRKRGEMAALFIIVVLPLLLMLPGLMGGQRRGGGEGRDRESPRASMPAWIVEGAARAFAFAPSELYGRAVSAASRGDARAGAASVLALFVAGTLLHGLGVTAFRRVLDSPAVTSARRRSGAPGRVVKLPGLSPGASAVAATQIRLALRTPRGRSILISPIGVFIVLAALMRRSGGMDVGFIELHTGLALATFGAAICLLSILPFAANQFAIDRSGLTLQLLSPLSDLDILLGKAAGIGLVACGPALLIVVIASALFPTGSPALWVSVPFGIISTYALAAPAVAALSAIFPRAVDLNSIGRRSNAHGAAGLLGVGVFGLAAAPPALLTLVAVAVLDRPTVAPLLLAAWSGISLAAARLLFTPVSHILNRRRENLAMLK